MKFKYTDDRIFFKFPIVNILNIKSLYEKKTNDVSAEFCPYTFPANRIFIRNKPNKRFLLK